MSARPYHRRYSEVFPGTDNKKENGDEARLDIVGQSGWVVITQDHEYYNRPAELQAIKQHNVPCFYRYDKIATAEATTPKPYIYHIN